MMETRYLTLKAAAKAAGCSVQTLRRAIATGSLRVYRPEGARAWRVRPDDLIAWVEGTHGGGE
jgi:excisionase family DNA binding protein